MNRDELKRIFPNASISTIEANAKLQGAEPECDAPTALAKMAAGKATGVSGPVERVKLRITGYRVRPLDPDNFAGGCKDIIDGLVKAELIKGDEHWRIILQTDQQKVSSFKEERTEIEIEYP